MAEKRGRTVRTESLIDGLSKSYKLIKDYPPQHKQDIVVATKSHKKENGWNYFVGTYDAMANVLVSPASHHGSRKITDNMYWIPLPLIGLHTSDIKHAEPTHAEYYDALMTKKRGLPDIQELWRCENFLKTGQISLYGCGFDPSQEEIKGLKTRLGAWLKRNGYDRISVDILFNYFLENYGDALVREHIYDYTHLHYCSQNMR